MKTCKVFLLFIIVLLQNLIFPQEILNINLSLKDKKLPFGLSKNVPTQKPLVSLVLSGGGSRAISHIGVIKAIEELNIPIDYIIGTSMGSVVGGLYSTGYCINEIDSIIKTINWEEIFFITGDDRTNLFVDQKVTEDKALVSIRLDGFSPVIPQSLNTGKKISNLLTSLTLNAPINKFQNFDCLLYKYRAVATELITGDRIVLHDGSLAEALRASSSVSFLLPPIKKDSLLLVDGGLVDNLPIKTAMELNPDIIIASDATSSLRTKEELIFPWEIADQIISIPSRKVWEDSKQNANVLITPNIQKRRNDDFATLDNVIMAGYTDAMAKLTLMNDEIKNKFRINLKENDSIFYNSNFDENPNELEKLLAVKYANNDSIKKSDILFDLYSFFETGNFENVNASVKIDSTSTISINYQYNPIVKTLNLNGISLISLDTAYTFFSSLINKPYNTDNILNSLLKLLRFYRNNDYMSVDIDSVHFDKSNNELVVNIIESKIGEVLIEGNENTLKSVITREFSSLENDYLLNSEFEESLENLAATDLFDNIIVDFENTKIPVSNLNLSLEEKLPTVLRLGLRIDNENFTQFAFDLRNENLFGTGSELGISINGGSRNMSYLVEHKTNRIFNTYLTYKAQAFYKFNDVNQYTDDVSEEVKKFSRSRISEYRQRFYGGFIGVGANLKKLGTLTAEAKYEVNEIDNLFQLPKSSEYKLNISSLRFRLQIDSQNKYPFPTKGIYINTFYETAQKLFGGDISFAKFSFDYSGNFSFGEKHTIKPRVIFGFADETLPLSQQFNFGGQSNFFGYRDYEFRGRQILVSSLQYRYKIPINFYFDTYFTLRYDLGSSWTRQEQIRFRNLKHGLGLTISFDTPIGPADFSVGRSLYLRDTSPNRILTRGPLMFYFTIGYYY